MKYCLFVFGGEFISVGCWSVDHLLTEPVYEVGPVMDLHYGLLPVGINYTSIANVQCAMAFYCTH